jgi:hypothetical protein
LCSLTCRRTRRSKRLRLSTPRATILEQDSEAEELQGDQPNTNSAVDSNVINVDSGDITCKQALDGLNVLLKNVADSRYKDVVMLQVRTEGQS